MNVLSDDPADFDWLVDTTEKWCQERAIYLSLMESVKIADGQDTKRDKGAIPQILSEALGVSFDQHVGHDYVLDAEQRYEFYHRKEAKIPFDLEFFNKITKGGLPNKTLNIALAGTGVGKSLFMCHMCVALDAPSAARTFYTSQWRWQRKKSLNALMQIFSTFRSKTN